MRAYLKDQFTFIGIATPQRRDALSYLNNMDFNEQQLLEIAESLWFLSEREYRYAAIDLLGRNSNQINYASIPRILNLVIREPWRETVDGLAGVISEVIARAKNNDMRAHTSFWVRRVALTHQLGWALRDYARWNPEAIKKFVSINQDQLFRLTYVEATKHIFI